MSVALLIASGTASPAADVRSARPKIVVHAVRVERQSLSAFRPNAATAYAGSVATIPSILEGPAGIAYDPDDGNGYVLDSRVSANVAVVTQISRTGQSRLFATLPIAGAMKIAYDRSTKNFFVTSSQGLNNSGSTIYTIAGNGRVSFLAGGGFSGQVDGTGSAASFGQNLSGITVDTKNGKLYVADGDRIRTVTTSGVVTTLTKPNVIGGGTFFGAPAGIAYNAADDNLYVADTASMSIRRISPISGSVSVVAGQCLDQNPYPQCDPLQRDGKGLRGLFASPVDIVADAQTNMLYVTDAGNASIRRIDSLGNVTTLAGNGVAAHLDGAGQNAEFLNPAGLTIDPVSHVLAVIDTPLNNGTAALPTVRTVTTAGAAPPPAHTSIALFDPVSLDPALFAIDWLHTAHPASTLIYTETSGIVGHVTVSGATSEQVDPLASAALPVGPYDVTYAFDNSQWLYESSVLLEHRLVTGAIAGVRLGPATSGFSYPGSLGQLAPAPNGDLWFVIAQLNMLGRVTPTGVVTSKVYGGAPAGRAAIAFASNGNPWVATDTLLVEFGVNGNVLINDKYSVGSITQGPDGNLWFTQNDAIGTIRPNNTIVLYPIFAPVPGCPSDQSCTRAISAITTGPDGALWVTENGAVARLTTGGVFSEFPVLAARTAPSAISPGPDGNVWFIDAGAKKIGRVSVH